MGNQLNGWLSDDDIERIHNDTLEILWERGMKVQQPQALELLTDAGAKIEHPSGMVRFPPELVERCMQTVPNNFVLGGRIPDKYLSLGLNSEPIVRSTSGAEGYIDLRTRAYRLGTTDDLIEWTRLLDGLDNIHICAGFYPCDVPMDTRDVFTIKTMMEHTTKPLFLNPYDFDTFKAIIDMAIAVRGSEQSLKERPLVTMLTSATAPGHILDYCIDLLLLAGKYGVPVEINSAPIMGGTSPVTIAGCVLQNNVEILSLAVISQLANPGTPLIHRGITMVMDMATGAGLMGTMECALAQVASSQLVRAKYNMPVATYGPMTDAKTADGQSQIERTIQTFLAGLTGSHMLLAPGYLEALYTVDPVQLTIDDEIIGLLLRILRGININEDTLAKELIKGMHPGGNYLVEMHTLDHFRTEHYIPKCFNRKPRNDWKEEGAKDLNQNAQERAINILETHQPAPLEESARKELDVIYQKVTDKKSKGAKNGKSIQK